MSIVSHLPVLMHGNDIDGGHCSELRGANTQLFSACCHLDCCLWSAMKQNQLTNDECPAIVRISRIPTLTLLRCDIPELHRAGSS